MHSNPLISSPGGLLMLAVGAGVIGLVLFLAANLIMKTIGMDINKYANETERYRNMGAIEQITAFLSDLRNIPVAIGAGGLLLLFGAAAMALGAAAWFFVRLLSG